MLLRPKVLLVSYYFPPAGGPGSLRLLSMVRHLPDHGFDPEVLTVRSGEFPQRDPSLVDRVPAGVLVERTAALEPYALYKLLTGSRGRAIPAGILSAKPRSLLDRALRSIRQNVFVPDARIGWVPFAVSAAKRIVRRSRVDCILTSSPPHSVHLAGRILKRATGLPWVADLRDPWTGIEYYAGGASRTRLARALDARIESAVLRDADAIVVTSEDLGDSIARAHGDVVARKVVLVRNGVDPEDFPRRDARRPPDRFRVTHVGQLPASRTPRTFIAAAREALIERPKLRERLEIRFVGPVDRDVRAEFDGAGLGAFCRYESFLPHREALAAMADSVLLLVPSPETGGRPDIVPAKLFECMASGTPVLAVARPGDEVARILEQWTGAPPPAPGDVPAVRGLLLQMDAAFVDGSISHSPPLPPEHARSEQVRLLSDALSAVIAGAGGAVRLARQRSMGRTRESKSTRGLKKALRESGKGPSLNSRESLVSIVVPVHDERESVAILHEEIDAAAAALGAPVEILYVDDGSRDGTADALRAIHELDERVAVLTLRRRFGKSAALDAGFRRARGSRIVTIDGDLQYDPADIPRLLARLGPDCDMAVGWRRHRALPAVKRLLNFLYNAACRRAARHAIRDFNCGLKAFRREVKDEIELYGELHRYFPVFASWRGFRLAEVEVASRPRRFGRSKFGSSRIFKAFFDLMTVGMLTRFAKSPLHVFGFLGVCLTAIGLGVNAYLSILWFLGSSIGSRPLLLFGVLLMIIGIQTTFFGLLAELIVNARRGEGEYAIEKILAHPTAGAGADRPPREGDARPETPVHA